MSTGADVRPSFCRICPNNCPVLVEVEDGRPVRVTGDPANDIWARYMCVKGRRLPELHAHPDRLLRSQKRSGDGTYRPISSELLMDEVAERLRTTIDRFGPRAVAGYIGTYIADSPASMAVFGAFWQKLGSPLLFTPETLDQAGKMAAQALHGVWLAPPQGFDEPDVGILIGTNPLVSRQGGLPVGHPANTLKEWVAKGFELIVIDPRRTDVAKRAAIHLQPRPGTDSAILAGMIRVILLEERYDVQFVEDNVRGLDALRRAVEPFTLEKVAELAGVDGKLVGQVARRFADARRGFAVAGTGPNMSGTGTIVEYLVLVLHTLCGRWLRAGDPIPVPATVLHQPAPKAQAKPPWPTHGVGETLRATGLQQSVAGLPVAGLPAEILSTDEDRVHALISCGGNPAASWPDQLTTNRALTSLDLLVQSDIFMSATARLADYVVATKTNLEISSYTYLPEVLGSYARPYHGLTKPWAQVTQAIVEPPPGSDVIEHWELFYGLAQRLGWQLQVAPVTGAALEPVALDMTTKPTADLLLDLSARGSRVSLTEVRAHPHGAVFPDHDLRVAPKDDGCEDRLDVGSDDMMLALHTAADHHSVETDLETGQPFAFRLLCRRAPSSLNSSRPARNAGAAPNPAFMHPDDLAELGLGDGDRAVIRSTRSSIVVIVEPDADIRPGTVSMSHGFGDTPAHDADLLRIGSSANRLVHSNSGLERFTGQPRVSNLPVSVVPY
jgi:anaerobic selenocysteine-containing dehydrogenase